MTNEFFCVILFRNLKKVFILKKLKGIHIMKKIISSLLLLVLLLGCVFAFVSCAKPNQDPVKAKAKLEKKGYTVVYVTDDTEEGKAELALAPYEGLVATIFAYNDEIADTEKNFDYVEIFYFKDKAAAETAYAKWEADLEKRAAAAEDADIKVKYGVKGSMMFFGVKKAVKAAK